MMFTAIIKVNGTETKGIYSKDTLAEYWKLGADIMVGIKGTSLDDRFDDLPLVLEYPPDLVRFFGEKKAYQLTLERP